MKKCTLSFIVVCLLLASPAFATISYVQSKSKWTCSGSGSSITCAVTTTSATTNNHLLAVWTFWQSTSAYTASVSDSTTPANTFSSAVGPTLQSASSTPITGQLFYTKNIQGSGVGNDTITVTFTCPATCVSPTIASAGVAVAEYSGADLNYPLDSVSAGHGNSTGTALDSGYSAPAFPTLMVFGAGIVDAGGTPTHGTGFATRESNSSGFCALAEDDVTPTAGSLQHANATCANSGNWLMQMAVFRDASPTVTGGWSPSRPSKILYADQYPGADACIQIANAFADAPPTGGIVDARGLIPTTANTTLTCSVNPIPANAKGRLLLSAGTYLAQVPWVIQSNDINIIGTGASDNTGSNNTIVQACASGQTGCGGVVFSSGKAVIQMGTSSFSVFRSTVKELAVDCQDVPGVSGFQVIAAQEETVFDLVKADGCRVAGFDIGVGDQGVQNAAALSNFEVGYPSNGSGANGCPTVTAGSMSGATRDSSGVVTATVSIAPSPALVIGNEVVITNFSNASFNGTYRVNSIGSLTSFTYQTSVAGGTTSGTGSVSPYPVGVRVWQTSGSPVRPIINGTINGSNCSSFPPIAMELSGALSFIHNIHTEGFKVGVQIGDLSRTSGVTLSNLKLENNTTTGVLISNQWPTAGVPAAEAPPTQNIDIFNVDVTGGDHNTTYSIIDNINNNTLTRANGNGIVGYYLFGANGVMTSAVPESLLINAFDVNGQTAAIYSGSASAVFSAGPTAVTIGTASPVSSLSINGAAPLTTTAQTGTNNIVLDTSPTLSGPTINSSVVNTGTGVKHVRSSSTAVPANTRTEIVVNWPGTNWSTANYSASCSVEPRKWDRWRRARGGAHSHQEYESDWILREQSNVRFFERHG